MNLIHNFTEGFKNYDKMRGIIYILAMLVVLGCNDESGVKVLRGQAFGTTYQIQYYGHPLAQTVAVGVDSVVRRVNASISTYQDNSLISAINRGETHIKVDSTFLAVFNLSREVYNNTDRYFDPTVGILRNAYGFGQNRAIEVLSGAVLDSLCLRVGLDKVSLDSSGSITKMYPEIYLDFNAIGKGYGIDLIGLHLESLGVTDYLVELGGEIRVKGTNRTKQKSWTIGIEAPSQNENERIIARTLELDNQSMASSGNYRKFRVDSLTGFRFVHTIDPLTCSAEQSNVTSATVLAATCAEADAYATAFMAMGLERSVKVLETQKHLAAYLTYIDQDQHTRWYATMGLEERLGY
jgi:FAD:protein FMN transferase